MKSNIFFIVSVLTIFLVSNHFHDLGINAQYDNIREGKTNYKITNGFFELNASKVSHAGWYGIYIAFFVLLIGYINLLVKKN